jgi:hypothetical protein
MAITAAMRTTVTQLYAALFNRAPDSDGLGYWCQQLETKTAAVVAKEMYDTTPARTYYPLWYSNEEIASQFYTNLLGRAADTDGKAYWAGELATKTLGEVLTNFLTAVVGYTSDPTATGYDAALDALALNSQQLFNNKVVVGQYFAETLRSNDVTLAASILTGVTTATGSITTVQAAYATAAATAAVTSFALTPGADVINGSNGNDLITGAIGTLSNVDEIHGGNGTDTMTIIFSPELATAGSATAASPIVSGVETLNITSRSLSAQLNFTDIKGVTTINVGGNNDLKLVSMSDVTAVNANALSAVLTVDLQTSTASTAGFGFTLNASASTAMDFVWADDSSSTAMLDTLTINALGDWGNLSSATTFSGVDKLALVGNGAVSISLASGIAGGMQQTGWADLTANNSGAGIDASGLSGNLTLRVDTGDFNIKGGLGADTFNMTANVNTNDTLDGGAGADTLNATLSGGYVRPVISNIETINLTVNNTAVTADFRDISGATAVNILLGSALLLDKLTTAISTITVNSSDDAANNSLQVNFGSAAVASDFTLNLGYGTQGIDQTAATAATGFGIGTITMSGNSGSLTIKTTNTAKYTAAAIELNDFTAVTLDAASANFAIVGVADVNTAQTLNLTVAAGKTMTIGDDLSADGVNAFTLTVGQSATFGLTGASASFNAASATVTLNVGASALADFSGAVIQMCGATQFNLSVGDSGKFTAGTILLGEVGATAGSGAVAMNTMNLSAGGIINIASMVVASAVDTAISMTINAAMTNTAAAIGISGFTINDNVPAGTANEQSVTFNVSGTGAFVLSAAATDSSNVTYHVDATNLAKNTGSVVTINLSSVNDTGSVASAVFGAASGSYVGVDGVDNIELGIGAVTVNGGLGADTITFSNTANSVVEMSVGTVAGVDTVIGAAAGDVILFSAARTATGAASAGSYLNSAWNTGTATTTAQISNVSFSAQATATGMTAVQQLAIYTSNGDTIIEAMAGSAAFHITAAAPATASDDFVRIVISNKDFTAITAAFQINTTGSGLSVTLL